MKAKGLIPIPKMEEGNFSLFNSIQMMLASLLEVL